MSGRAEALNIYMKDTEKDAYDPWLHPVLSDTSCQLQLL